MVYEFSEEEKRMMRYSKELNCEKCDWSYDCDVYNTDENIIECMKKKLFKDLKENQRKRDLIYKYNKQYLDIMGNYSSMLNNIECRMNYIDYLNMKQNKIEIKKLNQIGSEIVHRLVNEFNWCKV